jgi:hypothetical protein
MKWEEPLKFEDNRGPRNHPEQGRISTEKYQAWKAAIVRDGMKKERKGEVQNWIIQCAVSDRATKGATAEVDGPSVRNLGNPWLSIQQGLNEVLHKA